MQLQYVLANPGRKRRKRRKNPLGKRGDANTTGGVGSRLGGAGTGGAATSTGGASTGGATTGHTITFPAVKSIPKGGINIYAGVKGGSASSGEVATSSGSGPGGGAAEGGSKKNERNKASRSKNPRANRKFNRLVDSLFDSSEKFGKFRVHKKRKASKLKKVGAKKMAKRKSGKKKWTPAERNAFAKKMKLARANAARKRGGKKARKSKKKAKGNPMASANARRRRRRKPAHARAKRTLMHKKYGRLTGDREHLTAKGSAPVRRKINWRSKSYLKPEALQKWIQYEQDMKSGALTEIHELSDIGSENLKLMRQVGYPVEQFESARNKAAEFKKVRRLIENELGVSAAVKREAEQFVKDGDVIMATEANPRKRRGKKRKSKKKYSRKKKAGKRKGRKGRRKGKKARKGSRKSSKTFSLYSRKAKKRVSFKVKVNPDFMGINLTDTAMKALWLGGSLAAVGGLYAIADAIAGGKISASIAKVTGVNAIAATLVPPMIPLLAGAALSIAGRKFNQQKAVKIGNYAMAAATVLLGVAAAGLIKAKVGPQIQAALLNVPGGKFLAPAFAGVNFYPGMRGFGSPDFGALGDGYRQQAGDWGMTQVGGIPHGMRGVEYIPNRSARRGMRGLPSDGMSAGGQGMGEVQFYSGGSDGDEMYRESVEDDAMEADGLGSPDFGIIPTGL